MQTFLYLRSGALAWKILFSVTFATVLAALGIPITQAQAQTTSTAQQPATQSAALTKDDESFLKEAYQGGLYEVEVGRHAAANGKSEQVKQFGQQMVTDHTALNQKLADVARQNGLILDTDPSALTTTKIKTATVLTGAAFDKTYVPMMIHDHKSDIAAFEKVAATSSNAEVKASANGALPTLRHHLKMAQDTKASL